MEILVALAYVINIVILVPVCLGLLRKPESMNAVFGNDTTSRQILTCMYLTIIVISGYALIDFKQAIAIGMILFPFQIIYKLMSLILIKDKKVAVYRFNLFVAAFHSVTMITVMMLS